MKTTIHRASERGVAEHGWLHSRFSFSFADYHNPQRMGFGALRVINDDIIEPGQGFGMHPHRDMEIITIVTKGSVEHKDSEGNHGHTNAGEIQYMSAGSGILHSEYNASSKILELFQIWIHPSRKGGTPRYDKRDFNDLDRNNRWVLLVSPDGRDNSMPIKQDAYILTTHLGKGHTLSSDSIQRGHGRLLFIMGGEARIQGHLLKSKDEIQITDSTPVQIKAITDCSLLQFEVPLL